MTDQICLSGQTWQNHLRVPEFVPMDATAVYLDGNQLSGEALISDEFIGRKHLTELYLNSSGIEAVSDKTFSGLTELRVLHLEKNLLTNLSGSEFVDLVDLENLYLHDNALAHINSNTFAPLVSLQVLTLHQVWSQIHFALLCAICSN